MSIETEVFSQKERIKEALGGVSWFLWKTKHPAMPGGTPEAAVALCNKIGAESVCVKLTQGDKEYKPGGKSNVSKEWVEGVAKEGIKVSFWCYYNGADPARSAKVFWDEYQKYAGIDGVKPVAVLDLEVEAEKRPDLTIKFIEELRKISEGKLALVLCGWAFPDLHNPKKQAEFAKRCDGVLPMVYGYGSDPATYIKMYNKSRAQWQRLDPRLAEDPELFVFGGRAYVGDGGTLREDNMKADVVWAKINGTTGMIFWFLEWIGQYGPRYKITNEFLKGLKKVWEQTPEGEQNFILGIGGEQLGLVGTAIIRILDYLRKPHRD